MARASIGPLAEEDGRVVAKKPNPDRHGDGAGSHKEKATVSCAGDQKHKRKAEEGVEREGKRVHRDVRATKEDEDEDEEAEVEEQILSVAKAQKRCHAATQEDREQPLDVGGEVGCREDDAAAQKRRPANLVYYDLSVKCESCAEHGLPCQARKRPNGTTFACTECNGHKQNCSISGQ
jgi:hypothetical protein